MKRMISFALSLALLLTFPGCGRISDEAQATETEPAESQSVETLTPGNQTLQSQMPESSAAVQETDLSFADLSGYVFEFSSGVGAWATELTIEKDGYFHGRYYDGNMGDTGEGYDYGTEYSSVFSGHFTDLTKKDDTVWTMTLADISYQNTVGETQIDLFDKKRYIYTDAYGLGTAMQVYWKGTPTADLSREELYWIGYWLESTGDDSALTMPVLVDAGTENAFYSFERQAPYDEAKTLLEACQYSHGELEAALQQMTTQGDMNTCAQKMYENSDDCLNRIWNLVKYNMDETDFSVLLAAQQEWIAEKEATQESIIAEWGGGSGTPLAVYTTLADMTLERCKLLTEALA